MCIKLPQSKNYRSMRQKSKSRNSGSRSRSNSHPTTAQIYRRGVVPYGKSPTFTYSFGTGERINNKADFKSTRSLSSTMKSRSKNTSMKMQ